MRDEVLYEETYTTQAMSAYDSNRMSQFSKVTTKIPASFDGKTSWLALANALMTGVTTELDQEKRGPALTNRLDGDATI